MWNAVILFRLLVGALGCLVLLLLLGAPPTAAMGAALLYGLAPMFTRWAPQVSMSVEVAGAVAARGDPGAGAAAGPAAVRGGRRIDGGGGLRRAARGAGLPGLPRRRLGPLLVVARGAVDPRAGRAGGRRRCAARCWRHRRSCRRSSTCASRPTRTAASSADTRLALSDLDAVVRRKGLQPELLGWPLAIAAVIGAIGWRRRIAGTGPLCVAAVVWALRSLDTPLPRWSRGCRASTA